MHMAAKKPLTWTQPDGNFKKSMNAFLEKSFYEQNYKYAIFCLPEKSSEESKCKFIVCDSDPDFINICLEHGEGWLLSY